LYGVPADENAELTGLVVHAMHAPSADAVHAPRYCPTGQAAVLHATHTCPLR
jgi:hypothetical protein